MQGVELQLKHVHAVGVYGWGNVCEATIGEWLEDISQNQVSVTFFIYINNSAILFSLICLLIFGSLMM